MSVLFLKIMAKTKQNNKKIDDIQESVLHDIKSKNNSHWIKQREETALRLFHEASKRVPAYKDFLKKHKVNPSAIKTFKDFASVPAITKDNYLRKYELKDLSWDGTLEKPLVFTSTSGSTGEPFYFSRSHEVDVQSAIIHELYYKHVSNNQKGPVLVIVCFGMGVWIGGLITYQAFEIIGQKGYPVSIITPGINKEEIFKTLKKLAPNFSEVILTGYPPFLKDIIDESSNRGIDLKKLNIKLLFAAEAFTEKFRDYLLKKIGAPNPLLSNMNIYGSADIGTMAFETPLSILIRRIVQKKPKAFENIFGSINKTPTFAQYIPNFTLFEAPNGEVLVTGDSSIPLIRYNIGDHGGVYSFKEIVEKLALNKINIYKEAKALGIHDKLYQLPFVFVYERMDFSTTLYGLQIYPETIKEVLLDKPFNEFLTGKLTLVTKFDYKQNQYLEINLELQKDAQMSPVAKNQLVSSVIKNLREKNSEFRELSNYLGKRAQPKLIFWPFEDPEHFKPGIKQKWVKR